MDDDEGALIGREAELEILTEEIRSGRPGLVLLTGRPRIGKARMLRQVRKIAEQYDCPVWPLPDEDHSDGRLTIDRHTSVQQFKSDLGVHELGVNSKPTQIRLALIYGYRPDHEFNTWFIEEFVSGITDCQAPMLAIVAAVTDEAVELKAVAKRDIRLESLPVETAIMELRLISESMAEPLIEDEIRAYAEAIIAEPKLLDSFRTLLVMT